MIEKMVCIPVRHAEAISEALTYVGDDCPPLDLDGTWREATAAFTAALVAAGGDPHAEPSQARFRPSASEAEGSEEA